MKCNACGAEIDNQAVVCPYCGSEQMENARQEHTREVNALKAETEKVRRSIRSHDVSKVNQKITKIFVLLVVGILLLLGISALTGIVKNKIKLVSQDKALLKLEEYYQTADYEKLTEYYESLDDVYGGRFEKYRRVYDVQKRVSWTSQNLEGDYWQYVQEGGIDFSVWCIDDLIGILVDVKDYEREEFPCGEGEAMRFYREWALEVLENRLLFTQDEIRQMTEIYEAREDYDAEVFAPYSELITERLLAE